MADVLIHDEGSVVGFTPMVPEARTFFDEEVQSEDWQWMGATLWVDRRCAEGLLGVLRTYPFSLGWPR